MQLYTKILIGMLAGALLGLLVGPNGALLPSDGVHVASNALVLDAPNGSPHPLASSGNNLALVADTQVAGEPWLQVSWTLHASDVLRLQQEGAFGADTIHRGDRLQGWVDPGSPHVRRNSRLGVRLVNSTAWLGDVFLALIKLVVVPLVFLSLLVGVASLGNPRQLGRIGGLTLGYFFTTTVAALVIGVTLATLFRPGDALDDDQSAAMLASYEGEAGSALSNAAVAPRLGEQIVSIVPTNPFRSLVSGDMLQIIFLALLFGVALTLLDPERAAPLIDLADRANDTVIMVVMMAMELAPYGVAALLFKVVGTTGLGVLIALGLYSLVVIAGLLTQIVLVYGSMVHFGAKVPFVLFLQSIRPALLLAFSTSSSSATLPVTKQCVEENLGVSQPVSSFVLPLGATINMDGTALYQGVAALFIAQIYAMDLSMLDQMTIVLTATLASIGAAGVPGAGMVTLTMVLTAVGVPTEGVALILGVDRLLDMLRTVTNVVGDAAAALVMDRFAGPHEGEAALANLRGSTLS